jgi:sulfoxide reductase heme-binding subunit YedZ
LSDSAGESGSARRTPHERGRIRVSRVGAIKSVLVLAALAPVGWLGWGAWAGGLGANPIETITWETGIWTLRLLVCTIAVTPIRRLTGWNDLVRFRRMIGLFAFFYGTLHLTTYLWLDKFFDVGEIVKDVYKRPFITAGATALTLMIPLALTSTAGMIRRLGGRRWRNLHRLVYVVAVAGVVHYWWLVKADIRRPRLYALAVAVLLAYRVVAWLGRRRAARTGFVVQRT